MAKDVEDLVPVAELDDMLPLLSPDEYFHPARHVLALDAYLVKEKGWQHKMSPFWREELKEFFSSGKPQFVGRVGRRGGKSSSMCRTLVAIALYGEYTIPEGDKGVVGIFSVDRGEAAQRLSTIEAILKAVGYKKTRGEPAYGEYAMNKNSIIEILVKKNDTPTKVEFRVHAASRNSVGFTAIAILFDEMTRWQDKDTGANPAKEVAASVKPAMLSVPTSKLFAISSAWSTLDLHYEWVEAGCTEDQHVATATTWEANPTLTIEATKRLEKDPIAWAREYNNVPMSSGEHGFFDGTVIDNMVTYDNCSGENYVAADFGFTRNASAYSVTKSNGTNYVIQECWQDSPGIDNPLDPNKKVREYGKVAVRYGCETVMCDSHYQEVVRTEFDELDLVRVPSPTKPDEIYAMFALVRRLLVSKQLYAFEGPFFDRLKSQLKKAKWKPTTNSYQVILPVESESGGWQSHGDLAMAVVTSIYHASKQNAKHVDLETAVPYRMQHTSVTKPKQLTGVTAEQWYAKEDNAT